MDIFGLIIFAIIWTLLTIGILQWAFRVDKIVTHLHSIDTALNGQPCSMCAKKILIGELTKIDSGQFVCPSCRKQFRRSLAYKTGEAIRSIKK